MRKNKTTDKKAFYALSISPQSQFNAAPKINCWLSGGPNIY